MSLDLQTALEPVEWAYFYANSSCDLALKIYSFHQKKPEKFQAFHKNNKAKLSPYIQRIQTKKPLIRADDLQKLGVKPGVKMGQLLKEAERISINEEIQDKDALIEKLKNQLP